MKEATVNSNQAFIPYYQAAKIREPGEGSFNFPPFPIAPEFPSIEDLEVYKAAREFRKKIYQLLDLNNFIIFLAF